MLMVRLTPTAAMAGVTLVFAVAVVVVVAIRGTNAGIVVISAWDTWHVRYLEAGHLLGVHCRKTMTKYPKIIRSLSIAFCCKDCCCC